MTQSAAARQMSMEPILMQRLRYTTENDDMNTRFDTGYRANILFNELLVLWSLLFGSSD